MNPTLEFKISQLPESPGVYQMKRAGEIIYVGKAINLKNRVRQYFHSSKDHTPKVQAMVANIDDFDIILCDTELEALILECNLIKKYRPYYNILLKDDKQYPYIRIDLRQDYPRVELVRRVEKDGAKYFGPYIGATVVRDVLEVLHNSFPLRTCRHDFSFGHGVGGRHRPCLRYQMGLCLAPCTGNVFPGQYRQMLDEILAFLNGKHEDVVRKMRAQMLEASKNLDFERAATLRDRIAAMERVLQKQKALAVSGGDQDVVAVSSDGVDAVVEVIYMREGKILGSDHFIMQRAEAQEEESLAMFLLQYYDNAPYIPREILLGEAVEDLDVMEKLLTEKKGSRVHILVPQRGDKKKLVDMARKNAEDIASKRREQFIRQKARTVGACKELADALGLDFVPRRIEGYDISNTQGTLSVASRRSWARTTSPPWPRSSPAASPAASASGSRRKTRAGSRTGLRTCRTLCSSTAAPSSCASPRRPSTPCPWRNTPPCSAWPSAWRRSTCPGARTPSAWTSTARPCASSSACATRRTASPSRTTGACGPSAPSPAAWRRSPASAQRAAARS